MLRHSRANRHSLRASAYGIRCVLDIGALHDRASGEEEGATDVEFRVRAWIRYFRQRKVLEHDVFAILLKPRIVFLENHPR